MGLNAFILLPLNDDSILDIGDSIDNLKNFIDDSKELFDEIRNNNANQLFYDAENVKNFIAKYKTLFEQAHLPKIDKLSKRLRTVLGKDSINIQDDRQALGEVHYILWNLKNYKITDYTPDLIAEIAERIFQNPEGKYILLNIKNALEADRKSFLVFKDAFHKPDLPERFAHIPDIRDLPELKLWLATNHIQVFSLLDKNRFRRTSEVQQGKPVFQEINTNYYWYMDNFHKNEYEVFNSERKHIGVADLEGEIDRDKAVNGRTF